MTAIPPSSASGSPEEVRAMFSRISRPYDFLNRFFSMGTDQYWRYRLIRTALSRVKSASGIRIFDLATGSGDVALMFQKRGFDVVGGDFCPEMLEIAKRKGLRKATIADALQLPFPDASFDCCTVAFGLRNFIDKPAAMKEVARILKPGGWFHILEFTRPAEWFCGIYFFYLKHVMPGLAGLFCRDPEAYCYLARTVESFPRAEAIGQMLGESGYTQVAWKQLTLGIVAIHSGRKY